MDGKKNFTILSAKEKNHLKIYGNNFILEKRNYKNTRIGQLLGSDYHWIRILTSLELNLNFCCDIMNLCCGSI